jgi:hypothetical protein
MSTRGLLSQNQEYDMSTRGLLSQNQEYDTSYRCLYGGEELNINFIIFGSTLLGFEPTIYRSLGEQANHYTTDALTCKF